MHTYDMHTYELRLTIETTKELSPEAFVENALTTHIYRAKTRGEAGARGILNWYAEETSHREEGALELASKTDQESREKYRRLVRSMNPSGEERTRR